MTEETQGDAGLQEALRAFRAASGAGAPPEVLVSLLERQVSARGRARRRAPSWAAVAAVALACAVAFWAGRSSVGRRATSPAEADGGAAGRGAVPAALPKPPRIPFVAA
jgi:hypothetical protein